MNERKQIDFSGMSGCRIVSYNDNIWTPDDPEIKARIEQVWKRKSEEMDRHGGVLTNGALVRANDMWLDSNGVLNIQTQRSDYKTHTTTRDDPDIPPYVNYHPLKWVASQ